MRWAETAEVEIWWLLECFQDLIETTGRKFREFRNGERVIVGHQMKIDMEDSSMHITSR